MKKMIVLLLSGTMIITSFPIEVSASSIEKSKGNITQKKDVNNPIQDFDNNALGLKVNDSITTTLINESTQVKLLEKILHRSDEIPSNNIVMIQSEAEDYTYRVLNGTYCEIT